MQQEQQIEQQQQIQSSNAAAANVGTMSSSSPITQPTEAVEARAREDQQPQGLGMWL